VLIPKFTEESIPKFGTEGNGMKKICLTKSPAPTNRIDSMLSSETCFGTEFRIIVFSAEWFGTEFLVFAYIFVPWNVIPSCFLFRGMVQNGILSIFLLCGMAQNGIPRIFCSAEQPEFRQNKPIVPSIFLSEIANLGWTSEATPELCSRPPPPTLHSCIC
jgi:hypothetical protein